MPVNDRQIANETIFWLGAGYERVRYAMPAHWVAMPLLFSATKGLDSFGWLIRCHESEINIRCGAVNARAAGASSHWWATGSKVIAYVAIGAGAFWGDWLYPQDGLPAGWEFGSDRAGVSFVARESLSCLGEGTSGLPGWFACRLKEAIDISARCEERLAL
jgi:hypothetical protein